MLLHRMKLQLHPNQRAVRKRSRSIRRVEEHHDVLERSIVLPVRIQLHHDQSRSLVRPRIQEAEIRLHLSIGDLEPILREVMDTLGTREMEVQDREEFLVEYHIVPLNLEGASHSASIPPLSFRYL